MYVLTDIKPSFPCFFSRKKSTAACFLNIQPVVYLLLFLFLLSGFSAKAETSKNYLRIERSLSNERDDLTVTSIGGLVFKENTAAHIDLSYLESDINGDGLALDLGVGYVFNWDVSLFLGVGVSLGHNWDNDDAIAAYYPEAGLVVELAKSFGLTVSAKRYFNLYDENEDIVKIGLLFMH